MYLALTHTADNLSLFFDLHGMLIVFGGTFAAASISFPILKVLALTKVFLLRVVGAHKMDYSGTIVQILDLNKKASISLVGLNEALPSIKHPFLKEGIALVASGVLNEKEIRSALEHRITTTEKRLMKEANMFKSIGKFPPAFGLLATTLGMIAVLQKIGQPESQKLIGPAMSIGLIGTLYGITLANMVFLPIAENLTQLTHEEIALRRMILEGVCMIKSQVNPIAMRESLNSFLLPNDRIKKTASSSAHAA
jgi:chemotaxis protein MotA